MPNSSCALDANGNLMEASQIQFYNDVDDEEPLPSTQVPPAANRYRRGKRTRNIGRMQDILDAEADSDNDNPPGPPRQRRKAVAKPSAKADEAYLDDDDFFSRLGVEDVSDPEGEFSPGMPGLESNSDSDDDSDDDLDNEITNTELSEMLSTKTVPPKGKLSTRSAHAKISKKKRAPSGTSVSLEARTTDNEDAVDFQLPTVKQGR